MPNMKQYTAKREVRLDCGHTVKAGETFQVFSAFTCNKDCKWPLRILWAYSAPGTSRSVQGQAPQQKSVPPKESQATRPERSNPTVAR